MKHYQLAAAFLGAATMMASTYCLAQTARSKDFDLGKYEYRNSCASCHGIDGKGNGPSAASLKKPPSDLTTLSARNSGVLPLDRLYAWIDGRQAVAEHGDREMPIWGSRYSAESAELAEYFFDMPRGASVEIDMYVRSRILALIDYLNRIQAK